MSKVLILGAGGMLGHKVCQRLQGHDVVGTVLEPVEQYDAFGELYSGVTLLGGVDVLQEGRVEKTLDSVQPDVVINCVGIVKQLKEAHNAYLSVAINSCLPHKLAMLCARAGSRLLHISTDCVFDGARGRYTESDFSDARDLYGKSKFLGETTPEETAAVTLRTSIIGREPRRPTHGLLEWFLAQKGKTVRGFARAIYTGFTTIEIARVMQMVIDAGAELTGVHHVAGEPISKYDLLQLIREAFGLDVCVERDEEFQCDRSLLMGPFAEATGYVAPSWPQMIRELAEDPTPYDAWAARA